jgi:putative transposase
MSTFTQILYHVVFGTKNRKPTLIGDDSTALYRYLWGILKNHKCHLYRVNGTSDHIHLLFSLHPTVPLAEIVKDLKTSSTRWIKGSPLLPRFEGWQDGYSAFTHNRADRERLVEYIKKQEEHHRTRTFEEEYRALLEEAEIEFEERYLLPPPEGQGCQSF